MNALFFILCSFKLKPYPWHAPTLSCYGCLCLSHSLILFSCSDITSNGLSLQFGVLIYKFDLVKFICFSLPKKCRKQQISFIQLNGKSAFYQMENGSIISNLCMRTCMCMCLVERKITNNRNKQMKMESFKVIYNSLCEI